MYPSAISAYKIPLLSPVKVTSVNCEGDLIKFMSNQNDPPATAIVANDLSTYRRRNWRVLYVTPATLFSSRWIRVITELDGACKQAPSNYLASERVSMNVERVLLLNGPSLQSCLLSTNDLLDGDVLSCGISSQCADVESLTKN